MNGSIDTFGCIESDPLGWVDSELRGCGGNVSCGATSARIQDAFWQAAFPALLSESHPSISSVDACHLSRPRIPLLHAKNMRSDSLVHNRAVTFRCIVQDMLDVEFYVARARSMDSDGFIFLKYREFASGQEGVCCDHHADEIISESPVPGEAPWVQSMLDSARLHQAGRSNRKRSLEDEAPHLPLSHTKADLQSMKSQKIESHEPQGFIESGEALDCVVTDAASGAVTHGLSGAVVKLYDIDLSEGKSPIRLNDMIEVVGIYSRENMASFAPPLSSETTNAVFETDPLGALDDFEGLSRLKNIPVIHCVVFKKLCSAYPLLISVHEKNGLSLNAVEHNPCLPSLQGRSVSDSTLDFSTARSFVLERLVRALGGDVLAAEYIALSLISHAVSRNAEAAIGSLHLNLIDVAPNDPRVEALQRELSNIVPRLVSFRMDRDTLNDSSPNGLKLFLERDSSLLSSPLQCGPGTIFLIDETRMSAGALSQGGLRSIHALQSMIRSQSLPISMEYCAGVEIPTDACVIILSNSPSVIDENIITRVRSPSSKFPSQSGWDCAVDVATSDSVREWWARCRVSSSSLAEDMVSVVENDFVNARQADEDPSFDALYRVPNHKTDASSLHNWLSLSRLYATSLGEGIISQSHWKHARHLEWQRLRDLYTGNNGPSN